MNPKLQEVIFIFIFGILLTIASGLMQVYSQRLRNSKIAVHTYRLGCTITIYTCLTAGATAIYKVLQALAPTFLKMEHLWVIGIGALVSIMIFVGYVTLIICAAILPTSLIKKWIQRKSPEIEFPPPSANEETGKRKTIKGLIEKISKI